MAERDLSDCGDGGEVDEPFPADLIVTSAIGGAAVSGMGQLQSVGPKIVLAQGTHSTPRRTSENRSGVWEKPAQPGGLQTGAPAGILMQELY